jgi:hypothetical protein
MNWHVVTHMPFSFLVKRFFVGALRPVKTVAAVKKSVKKPL